MRRTVAGIAVILLSAVALTGPLASAGQAGPATLQCATGTPPPACALLDKLAAQLKPVATILAPLSDAVGTAQGLAARSDSPGGVPVADVVSASKALSQQLSVLPNSVEALLGEARLDGLTTTLTKLIAEASAPVGSEQQAAQTSQPTPAQTPTTYKSSSSSSAPRATSAPTLGGSSSAASSSSSPSSASVPDVPVGDPLSLAPLGMPDFGFSQTFEPVTEPLAADVALSADTFEEVAMADAIDSLPNRSHRIELVVVAVLSLLLVAGAGIAQFQQSRQHVIPD